MADRACTSSAYNRGIGFDSSWRSAVEGFESLRRSAVNGFTLIEMMVALAVFSLAAMALIWLEGATIRSTGILESTLIAQMVARNIAVETLTDSQPPAVGVTKGNEQNGGRAWTWTRATRPLGDQGALRVDVVVADKEGSKMGRLTVVRAPAPTIIEPAVTP